MEKSKTTLKKNVFTVLLLSFAGSLIYGLPYYRYYFYDSYVSVYHLTNVQMGMLGSAYGMLGLVSYILGGVLADRFNAKYLVVASLLMTGGCGFLHLFASNYYVLIAIYVIWGVTSLLTFWPACVKMVRMQGGGSEQSRAYGIFEGARGALNAGHLAIATVIFAVFEAKSMPAMGINGGIIFYSVCPLVAGILLAIFLKNPNTMEVSDDTVKREGDSGSKVSVADIVSLLKMPSVWLIVGMVFCSYTFNMSTSYFNPYATQILGASAVVGVIASTSTQYIRPFGTTIAGFLADKFGKSTFMILGFILMIVGMCGVMGAGRVSGSMVAVCMIAGLIIMYIGMYFCFGLHHSFMNEGGVPVELSGTCVGVVCTLGYLPEVICSLIAGSLLDKYPGIQGYYMYFTYMLVLAVAGIVISGIWGRTYGKRAKESAEKGKNTAGNSEASGVSL